MSYNETVQKTVNVKEQWEGKQADITTDKTVQEMQSIGGSKKFGHGGRWLNDTQYVALNGHASKGGFPLKLRCADGEIPISTTDAQILKLSMNNA